MTLPPLTPQAARQTVWETGRLKGTGGGRILFGRMYEDAEIEREAFRGRERIFCIASAGCTAIRLAGDHEVVACDINPVQLAYAERRMHGAVRERGAAERILSVGRQFAPLAGWRRRRLVEFLSLSQPEEQIAYWRRHLDTRRFRLALDLLLSPRWLGLVYSAPLLAVLPPHFGAVARGRLERGFARHANATNPFAWSLLLGEVPFAEAARPADRQAQFVAGDAASYLESCERGCFDGFTLSNILDGATPSYCERLWNAVRHAARPGSPAVIRSFAEPGATAEPNLAARDRSLLWGSVEVRFVGREAIASSA